MPNLPYQTYHAKPTLPNSPCQTYHTKLTMPNLPYQTYHAKPTIPNSPCQTYHTKLTMTNLRYQTHQKLPYKTYHSKSTIPNSPCQTYHTKLTIPNLQYQTYHANLPCRTYPTKLTMSNLQYQTYHAKPTMPNLPSQTYLAKPTIPNLPYQTYNTKPTIPNLPCQISLRRASRWAASSSCWSAVGRRPCAAPPTWSRPATGSSPARCSGGTATRPDAQSICRLQGKRAFHKMRHWRLRVASSAGHCKQRGEGKALFMNVYLSEFWYNFLAIFKLWSFQECFDLFLMVFFLRVIHLFLYSMTFYVECYLHPHSTILCYCNIQWMPNL